jgi:hypothetical protein
MLSRLEARVKPFHTAWEGSLIAKSYRSFTIMALAQGRYNRPSLSNS